MSNKINAIRGMRDILPDEVIYWQIVEHHIRELTGSYGYKEVRLPIVESTDLFKRSVGQVTDIVEKEMYTFLDRNGDSLTLRPEGTAGVVRAGIEHSLFYGSTPKVWYTGPMFRHERPQKGRYRQFYQFGMEAFGVPGPHADAEIIAFCARLWQRLGLQDQIKLQINCLGTKQVRDSYREELVSYFKANFENLDEDSKNRLDKNPLRILDSKNPELKQLIEDAPKLTEHLDDVSTEHMEVLYSLLDKLNIKYEINPYLVRGLDYYCLTVFEWVTEELGAQGTVCAGGRYDGLVAEIGGQATPAVGMSLGMERLILMLDEQQDKNDLIAHDTDVFVALVGDKAMIEGMSLAEGIRTALPELKLNVNLTGQSFKNQLKKADKSGAKLALIIGDDEVEKGIFTIKYLREHKEQQQITFQDLLELLKEELA